MESSFESIEDFDYSDETFESFEEIQINDEIPTDQTPSSIDKLDLKFPSSNRINSAVDIIDTFILSQLDFLNQLKEMAMKNTINK